MFCFYCVFVCDVHVRVHTCTLAYDLVCKCGYKYATLYKWRLEDTLLLNQDLFIVGYCVFYMIWPIKLLGILLSQLLMSTEAQR